MPVKWYFFVFYELKLHLFCRHANLNVTALQRLLFFTIPTSRISLVRQRMMVVLSVFEFVQQGECALG